jgi:CO/xanthine dehydrogenase FAD-binding subunit
VIDITYHRSNSIEEATQLLQLYGGKLITGGTDILPRLRKGNLNVSAIIDLSPIESLRYIREVDEWVEIGASTTHRMLERSDFLNHHAPALVMAAGSIGCPQTRARGTIGGNLANASPAADTVPPLLSLDADIVVQTPSEEKIVKVSDFFLGPGKTIQSDQDLITSIRFKNPQGRWGSSFLKLGRRKGMAISIASVAVYLHLDSTDHIDNVRLAYGSLAPTPVRAFTVEKALKGQSYSTDLFQYAVEKCEQDISPIEDIRASAEYRLKSAKVLTVRALEIAFGKARESNAL